MSTVFLAEDLKHHRAVAIKVLKPEIAIAVGGSRFLREIEISAQLTHPNLLPLHDSGEVDGFLYYVMPYIEGETLRDRLKRERQLPLDDAIAIACDVAEGLQYAHAHGIRSPRRQAGEHSSAERPRDRGGTSESRAQLQRRPRNR